MIMHEVIIEGKTYIFCDEGIQLYNKYKWKPYAQGYLRTSISKGFRALFHKMLLGCEKEKHYVDHINRSVFDNRKENLRICSSAENQWNVKPKNHVKYDLPLGVTFDKRKNKFLARIRHFGIKLHLGSFTNPQDAAEAYKIKAESLRSGFLVHNKSVLQ